MQSSITKDVYIILILSLITVCLWSYLLIAAQEKIPATNAMDVHVQDFMAKISILKAFIRLLNVYTSLMHSLTHYSKHPTFWSVHSRTACHLYQWQSSSPLYSQLFPASCQTCPPPRRDLFVSCDLYTSMNCLIFSPLGGLHTGTYHWSQRKCH
jgi:hypothetical protein